MSRWETAPWRYGGAPGDSHGGRSANVCLPPSLVLSSRGLDLYFMLLYTYFSSRKTNILAKKAITAAASTSHQALLVRLLCAEFFLIIGLYVYHRRTQEKINLCSEGFIGCLDMCDIFFLYIITEGVSHMILEGFEILRIFPKRSCTLLFFKKKNSSPLKPLLHPFTSFVVLWTLFVEFFFATSLGTTCSI